MVYHSDLLGFIVGFFGWIIGILYVRMSACSVRMLDENMKIVFAIHKDLIFNNSSFLKVL